MSKEISEFDRCDTLEETYIVEKILQKKKFKGVYKYLIKWEGYPDEQNTWEPIENLIGVKDLLDEFESRFLCKKRTRESGLESCNKSMFEITQNVSETINPTNEILSHSQIIQVISPKPDSKKRKVITDDEIITKQIHGDLKYHRPNKIIEVKLINNNPVELNCLVEWEKVDENIPKQTWVSSQILKKNYPEILISFYESYIKLI